MRISYLSQGSLQSLLAFALVMLSIVAQGQPPMVMEGDASAVHETYISLSAGVPVTIETRNLSAGGDPVLNLLSTDGTEVAADDNSAGGFASRITYTPSKSSSYILIMRAKISSKKGTADIYKDGILWQRGRSFGGWQILVSGLRKGETIETVKIPNGASGLHKIYILKGDAIGILTRIVGGGTLDGALYTVPTTLGSKFIVIGTNFGSEGVVRLVRNDCAIPGHDPDKDGLGSELEAAVGTCSSLTGFAQGFDCRQAADAKDTDGDGIPDNWEVLGRRDMNPHQPLPLWGANPRRADLFIEVDRITQQPQAVNDDILITLREIYLDIPRWLNPDGTRGIAVHVDAGEPCSDPILCGDWGGSEIYDHDCHKVPDTNTVRNHFKEVRRGIFHYALRTCGAQAGDPDYGTVIRIGPQNNEYEAELWAHELGHSLGLGHHGDNRDPGNSRLNYKVTYPSIMNYNYQNYLPPSTDPSRFSEGRLTPLNLASQSEQIYSPGQSKTHMSETPYFYTVVGDSVDFNRDGRISSFPVMHDYTPLNTAYTGNWPEIHQLRNVSTGAPSGGAAIAVQPLTSDGSLSRVFVIAPFRLSISQCQDRCRNSRENCMADRVTPPGVCTTLYNSCIQNCSSSSGKVNLAITWIDDRVGGEATPFGPWRSSLPFEGSFDFNGEVGAAQLSYEGEPSVFVTFPGNDGKLYYSWFKSESKVWSSWTGIPAWPVGTRARQATVARIKDDIWVLYRDMNADEGVQNTWINKLHLGSWTGWELLNIPSYMTPGIALASDNNLYLLYAHYLKPLLPLPSSGELLTATSDQVNLSLEIARRPISGGAFTAVNELTFTDPGFGNKNIPVDKRTRLQLEFLLYRRAGGTPFSDKSGYLAAFWTSGAEEDQDTWLLKRAYTPGYIAPEGACFGASPTRAGCGGNVQVHWRAQKQVDRPKWGISTHIALRWNGVSAVYVKSHWDTNNPALRVAKEIAYVPWASGIPTNAASLHTDNNDAKTMRDSMCRSLRALEGDTEKCEPNR